MKEIPGITYADFSMESPKTGFAKACITPQQFPIKLTSYNLTAYSALDDLYVKCLNIENQIIICSVDLLFIPIRISKRIAAEFPTKTILLVATHAHATPSPIDPGYQPFLERQIIDAVKRSGENLTESTLEIGHTTCRLNMNRRRPIRAWKNLKRGVFKKTIEVRPNPKGARDKQLTVIRIIRGQNPRQVFLLNYPCHATMWHGTSVSADWPGRIGLDEYIFLQGFMGNLIPYYQRNKNNWKDRIIALYEGTKDFRKKQTTETDMNHAGNMITEAVNEITEYHPV